MRQRYQEAKRTNLYRRGQIAKEVSNDRRDAIEKAIVDSARKLDIPVVLPLWPPLA